MSAGACTLQFLPFPAEAPRAFEPVIHGQGFS